MSFSKKILSGILGALISVVLISASTACAENKLPALEELNIVMIVVDTLAVEQLSPYNSQVTFTPNVSKLATGGVLFKRAYSPSSWTKPSIASLITGQFPSHHKVIKLNDILPENAQTSAEVFKQLGFSTAGFISHTLIDSQAGYAQGFDSYRIVPFKGNVHAAVTSTQVSDLALEWLSEHAQTENAKRFFLFLHYFDPHYNYQHHTEFNMTAGYKGKLKPGTGIRALRNKIPTLTSEDIKFLIGLYKEEIAYTDKQIGRVIDYLAAQNTLNKNTLIIFTADHGEEFMRHGWIGHTRTLYDELIHVPLIYYLPGKLPARAVSDPVTTMDTLPTLLSLSKNFKSEIQYDGISLAAALRGESLPKDRDVFSEVDFKSSNVDTNHIAVVSGTHKLILDKKVRSFELFDLLADPEEKHDLFQSAPQIAQALMPKLLGFEDRVQSHLKNEPAESIERTPAEIEQLKSLGYL